MNNLIYLISERTKWTTLGKRCSEYNELQECLQSKVEDSYALTELQKDVEKQLLELPEEQREVARTKFAIFVVHNKVRDFTVCLMYTVAELYVS